jgi:adenylate cyclase
VLPQLVPVLVGAGVVLFAFVTFGAGTVFDLATPAVGTLLAWAATMTWKQLTEGRYNRWLEATFSYYLAPSVIESLKADPSLLHLGGSRRELSVLFSDVASFTSHSRARRATVELQRYSALRRGLRRRRVDKFIGDAVVAFYGDPIPMADHAVRACRTALAVIDGLSALAPTWKGMGLPEFHVRLGINSGPVVVGNMGSQQRFAYTVMGDTVNLASRLEG